MNLGGRPVRASTPEAPLKVERPSCERGVAAADEGFEGVWRVPGRVEGARGA